MLGDWIKLIRLVIEGEICGPWTQAITRRLDCSVCEW